MSDLQRYVSVRPNSCQKRLETMGFYLFVHFGVNTFTGREWGTGKESPACFNPTELDTDQWCAVASEIGAKGIILTAKHHDGFCLWQTETTPHSVRNSPFRNGKGDVLKELEQSCKKFGLALGVYLSPWDRNAPSYGTEAYNDFYCRQLEELLTRYGDLFTVWLDGACGAHMDGKPVQTYDFAVVEQNLYVHIFFKVFNTVADVNFGNRKLFVVFCIHHNVIRTFFVKVLHFTFIKSCFCNFFTGSECFFNNVTSFNVFKFCSNKRSTFTRFYV